MSDEQPQGGDEEIPEAVDMSPEQAAEAAVGEETPTPDTVSGGFDGVDQTPWWKKTEPNPAIEDVEPVEKWEEYWKEYLVRGGQKAAGADDAMAAFDLIRGVIGGSMRIMDEYDL